jgi:hypothetical protein
MSSQQLVDELCAEGEWSGQDHFKVDVLRRSQKLFRLQLNQPHLYLLKFVQAAVSLGAEAVTLQASGSQVQLAFSAPAVDYPVHRLLAGEGVQERGLQHLQLAMLLCAVAEGTGFEVKLNSPGGSLRFNREGVSTADSSDEQQLRVEVSLGCATERWWKLLARKEREETFKRTLTRRLQFCPIPVTLNGVQLNEGDLQQTSWASSFPPCGMSFFEARGHRSYRWLLERSVLASADSPRCALAAPAHRKPQRLSSVKRNLLTEGADTDRGRAPETAVLCSELDVVREEFAGNIDGPTLSRARLWLNGGGVSLLWWKNAVAHAAGSVDLTMGGLAASEFELPAVSKTLFVPFTLYGPMGAGGRLPLPALATQMWAGVAIVPHGESLLIPVLDGLQLDPVRLDNCVAGAVIVAAQDWRTDLGQLQVIDDEVCQSYRAQATTQLDSLLQVARDIFADWRQVQDLRFTRYPTEAWPEYFRSL